MADRFPRICISAGHGVGSRVPGREDPGAEVVDYDGTESDLVLNAAKSVVYDLNRLFTAKKRGYAFLRDVGAYYLADDYAVNHDCDIFIELHTDAGGKRATGTSVLYESDASHDFAAALSRRLATALHLDDDGAKKRTDLAVLSPHTTLPRQVLVEMFFGSNPNDVAHWKRYRDAAILAIVNAVLANRGWKTLKKRPRDMSALALRLYKPY